MYRTSLSSKRAACRVNYLFKCVCSAESTVKYEENLNSSFKELSDLCLCVFVYHYYFFLPLFGENNQPMIPSLLLLLEIASGM